MKALLRKPEPPPDVVVLEMTQEEAQYFCALVGGVSLDYRANPALSEALRDLYEALDGIVVAREYTFTDLFAGGKPLVK